jgi:ABC-type phosphate transport system auxiliary subunit
MADIDEDTVDREFDAPWHVILARRGLKAAAVAIIWLVVVAVFLLIGWPGMWRHAWAALR